MCGIVGYAGNKKSIPVLIEGLKSLEYRGYDSAGIAYLKNNHFEIIKSVGKISNLEKKINIKEESNLGIGHTRWATHGIPNKTNAHPHEVGDVIVVHNGIIENYEEIKKTLSYDYKSDTDSEVICALINDIYKKNKNHLETLKEVQTKVRGSYALGIVFKDDLDHIYAMRKDSPLIIAIGKNENYIASDVPAILNITNRYILLEQKNITRISSNSIEIFDEKLNPINYQIKEFKGTKESISKNDYDHYMLKEIYDQPKMIEDLIKEYFKDGVKTLLEKMPDLSKYNRIDIVACGSAYHTGLVAKSLFEKYLKIKVNIDVASEYRYNNQFLDEKSLVILISQSGETADTLAALRLAKESGAYTIGIVNVFGSSIAREADEVLYIKAGCEIAVATTKAYSGQLFILSLLILANYLRNNKLDIDINNLPKQIKEVIEQRENYYNIAKKIYKKNSMFFIGRKIDYALSMEGALKLKEISYIHCEAYAAGELKHGTISLIEKNMPVIAIITDKQISEKTISNIKETKARGAKVIIVATEEIDCDEKLYDNKITVPKINELFQPILTIIPLQLIAYEVAKLKGEDIDKPRNLAKSVTVE